MHNTGMLNSFESLRLRVETVGLRTVVCLDGSLQLDLDELRRVISPDLAKLADAIKHPERQREWILSRLLLIAIAGYIPEKGDYGELLWNGPHKGSLTHKKSHVALAFQLLSPGTDDPGIDLELVRDLHDELQLEFVNTNEIEIASKIGVGWSTAVFSAKEAIFKCLFRSVGFRFYFEAVDLIDLCAAGDQGIMMFRTTRKLGPNVASGSLVRVDFKQVRLGADEFWLTSARRRL